MGESRNASLHYNCYPICHAHYHRVAVLSKCKVRFNRMEKVIDALEWRTCRLGLSSDMGPLGDAPVHTYHCRTIAGKSTHFATSAAAP